MTVTPAQLEAPLKQIAKALEEALPKMVGVAERVGFAVFLFDFGPKGSMAYVSNASREDMMAAVCEWLDLQETPETKR
jgi:hypothetical protein